jgi:thioredoxin reductase
MEHIYDYLIIGAGPAGLQLGYFFEKNQRDYLILERGQQPGNFFSVFPRHRMLISINKVHTGNDNADTNLRWDWNSLLSDNPDLLFKNYSQRYFPNPDDLVKYLGDFASYYQLKIRYNTSVKNVSRQAGLFTVTDQDGKTISARRLIVASGFTREFLPDFDGWELCDTYARHSVDKSDYVDKRVLIVGKGNSGFETAEYLTESAAVIHVLSPHSIKMAWESHYVGNLRAVNNNFLDTYQLKSQNAVIDGSIRSVKKVGDQYLVDIAYTHAKGQTRLVSYDKVILCTGFRFDDTMFDESCKPEMVFNDKLPAQTPEWESVNIPGMYFAGTLMQACDFKKTMSGFIHGFRYNVRLLSHLLEYKYEGVPLPCETIGSDPEQVLEKILNRLNTGSGIILQPGFMNDVVVIKNGTAEFYTDMRHDYIHYGMLGQNEHYYTVSLEYGHFDDPFSTERNPDPEMGDTSSYIHPVIRRFSYDQLVAIHHIQDDLENEWVLDEYVKPARAFFRAQLVNSAAPDRVTG